MSEESDQICMSNFNVKNRFLSFPVHVVITPSLYSLHIDFIHY